MIKAALFDLDGVVFETESQYSIFWGKIGREYHPEIPDFEYRIKGQTLVQIYDKYFSEDSVFAHIEGYTDPKSEQDKITARLNEFEQNMKYPYIPGVENFIKELKQNGVKCAVVTSSNIQKMLNVYKQHPEFKGYFDRVLEDSFNGLKAVRASGAFTLGLSTTNSAESIAPYSDYVIPNYEGFTFADLVKIVGNYKKNK